MHQLSFIDSKHANVKNLLLIKDRLEYVWISSRKILQSFDLKLEYLEFRLSHECLSLRVLQQRQDICCLVAVVA